LITVSFQGDQRLRRLFFFLVALIGVLFSTPLHAQNTQSRAGEPPIASLISVSSPNARGNVTVSGAGGAVFPNAQVAVRNLFTGQTVYVNAGITGSFNAELFATGVTPFWISAANNIPPELRNETGSLPGGPGTIIYSTSGEGQTTPITQLIADGGLSDWDAYDTAELIEGDVFGLHNRNSAYLALNNSAFNQDYTQVVFTFAINNATYTVTLNREQLRLVNIRQTAPTPRSVGDVAANIAFTATTVEFRFPLIFTADPVQTISLTAMRLLDAEGAEVAAETYDLALVAVQEVDGVVYPEERLPENAPRFYVAGVLGDSFWYANGRINALTAEAGDELVVEMDVTMLTPTLSLSTNNLTFTGFLGLQPVSVPALYTNNGWSSLLTPGGLAIDNLRGDLPLGEASTEWVNVTRLSDRLLFGLRFEVVLPEDLPSDVYVPVFNGSVRDAENGQNTWTDFLGTERNQTPLTRLPIGINIGGDDIRLHWALFYNHPSDGSRGILAQEDAGAAALSNRVKFNAPTYILPPGTYPVEPHLPNMMPNRYDFSTAPLLPLLFPGGSLMVDITRPSGGVEVLGSNPILQNQLSSSALDESVRFGRQSPIDLYRLTTLNPQLSAYNFNDYGEYTIDLTGEIEDRSGNTYTGGGTYRLLIAELLDLTPGVLSGTPFEVGDHFYPGLHLTPQLPAEVSVTVRVYPLDGSEVIEETFTGVANAYGHYSPVESFEFNVPGEYVIDYEARYSASDGRLWAASMRSAGVIASPEGSLLARGRRGLDEYRPVSESRPAWFNQQEYPNQGVAPLQYRPYYPYHPGDVAVYADSANSGIHPIIDVQDLGGAYADWLSSTVPNFVSSAGETLAALLRRDALPLLMVLGGPESSLRPVLLPDLIVNQAYSYVSAVRPGVTVRQFVQGDDSDTLPLHWDANDPLNGQIGAGIEGDRPGDYVFLFGGAVIHNAEAETEETAIYAGLGITGFIPGDGLGIRVYPPFRGFNGGTLLRLRGQDYAAFFHPTSVQPGQVMLQGETLAVAGQGAPTLTTQVRVTVTSPSGQVRQFNGLSNRIGYFYQPENNFTVDEVGVWTVEIQTTSAVPTSSGEQPNVTGSVPGAENNRFNVYVTRLDTDPLTWNRGGDIEADVPAGAFFNFTINIPPGLSEVQTFQTTTMPGYVLNSTQLQALPNTTGYQYSPRELTLQFPMLEAEGRGDNAAASDVVNVIFAVIGTDDDGERQLFTRTFTFMHNQIISFEGEE
jgi:hypothetical protein